MVQRTLNQKDGHLEKLKFALHAFKEGHQMFWNEAGFHQIEHNRYRKYKDDSLYFLYLLAFLGNTISRCSFDFSCVWIPLISKEVNKQHGEIMDSGRKTVHICVYCPTQTSGSSRMETDGAYSI